MTCNVIVCGQSENTWPEDLSILTVTCRKLQSEGPVCHAFRRVLVLGVGVGGLAPPQPGRDAALLCIPGECGHKGEGSG